MVFHVYTPANALLPDDMYLCKNVERGRVKWISCCLNTKVKTGLKCQNAHKDVMPYVVKWVILNTRLKTKPPQSSDLRKV